MELKMNKVGFYKWLIIPVIAVLMINCNSGTETKSETQETKEVSEDPKDLILGKWIFIDEESGLEFWMFLDENKVYSDGMEEGADYRIENNVMITSAYGTESYTVIVSVDEEELILDTDGSIVTWTRSL